MLEQEDDRGDGDVGAKSGEQGCRDVRRADVLQTRGNGTDKGDPSRLDMDVDPPRDDGEEDDDKRVTECLEEERRAGEAGGNAPKPRRAPT